MFFIRDWVKAALWPWFCGCNWYTIANSYGNTWSSFFARFVWCNIESLTLQQLSHQGPRLVLMKVGVHILHSLLISWVLPRSALFSKVLRLLKFSTRLSRMLRAVGLFWYRVWIFYLKAGMECFWTYQVTQWSFLQRKWPKIRILVLTFEEEVHLRLLKQGTWHKLYELNLYFTN